MSDINLGFTVDSSNINVVVEPNDITFTPTDIQLTISTGGVAAPGGASGQLQYNNGGVLGGVANTSYSGGNLSLGAVSNVRITGGTNGYVLQTDGTGNLTWTAQTGGGGGNGVPGGSNTQIQYNDSGAFGGNVGFTFNETTGDVNIPGIVTANGSGLSSLTGANVTGTVANAAYAVLAGSTTVAGTVTTNSQPNITSTGTLTVLNVSGTTSIQQAIEKVTSNSTGSTGTVNFDLLTQAILYKTGNASGNFTLNIRGNSSVALNTVMSSDQSMTCTYINTNTFPAYVLSGLTIDGASQTVKWINGSSPTGGTSNALDSYTFNIIKTAANTYTVLGSVGAYY